MSNSLRPKTAACQASLSFTISQILLKLMSTESVMPSNHLILCHLLRLPPSVLPSIRVFSNESVLCSRWPDIGASASASVLPMNVCVCVCVCVLVTQSCLTNYDPRTTVACQAPLSMGFSMQEYWSRLPLSSPGPHNEYSGLISFRSDWFDLLAVQETLKNLL